MEFYVNIDFWPAERQIIVFLVQQTLLKDIILLLFKIITSFACNLATLFQYTDKPDLMMVQLTVFDFTIT